jgi:hypothetical protein
MEYQKSDNSKLLKVIIVLLSFIVLILILFGGLLIYKKGQNNTSKVDDSLRLQDDFYAKSNYETLKNMSIPSSYSSLSIMHDAQLAVNIKKENLIDEIINKNNFSNFNFPI